MTKYIDKNTVVAEIKKLRDNLQEKVEISDFIAGEVFIMNYLISLFDTFEVEEVDLDAVIDTYMDKNFGEPWDGARPVGSFELATMAEYFFKLGKEAAQKKE